MNVDAASEQDLIERAQRGDVAAFNELVCLYQGLAYNIAFRLVNDAEAAADATQDAFLSAYRALGSFRGGSFKAWLLRIVTNACYDELRRWKRRPTSSLDALLVGGGVSDALMEQTESPEAYALRKDLGRTIQEGLQTLPDDQRTAVILSDIEGLRYKEIAEITGAQLGTVKSRIHRGRVSLRDYLRRQESVVAGELVTDT